MGGDIDFTQGGYEGGDDEKFFKPFTNQNMEYWWYFREVLRGGQKVENYWKKTDGTVLADADQRELIALSLLNYAVHTGIVEAITFFDEMRSELNRIIAPIRFFDVRRFWKATYSSLYTSFNALSNIVYVLATGESVWKKNEPSVVMNYTPNETAKKVKNVIAINEPLSRCADRLSIRSHLDHYWTIWINVQQGQFLMDENFKKGYVALRPHKEVKTEIDALKRTDKDIIGLATDFNLIYRELSVENGYLDQYLQKKGWMIDYSDYGPPHNGQRPKHK